MSSITTIPLRCGMTLVAEPIDNVASAAVNWLIPVGAAGEADETDGHATMLSELVFRGAGGRSSREHSDALDRAGVQRSSTVLTHHLQISATLLGLVIFGDFPDVLTWLGIAIIIGSGLFVFYRERKLAHHHDVSNATSAP